ncbi:MAG: MATE family efflux transporter [Candidatus Pristimantibacillus sp.]
MEKSQNFYTNMFKIAVPIAAQSLIMSVLYLTDQIMVGQLGDAAVASVGIASKIYAIIAVVLAGLSTAVSIFTAQFWGNKDTKSITELLGLGLLVGCLLSILFSLIVFFNPRLLLAVFTKDATLIEEGYRFIKIVAISYVPTMLTMIYSAILRSTGHVKAPMYVSLFVVVIHIGINYVLIFGHYGFPRLGLEGSAYATVIARMIECILIIGIVYRYKLPGAVGLQRLFTFSKPMARLFTITAYPIVLTELIWVLGEAAYAVIYSRMGTVEMTAMTATFPLQGLSIGLLSGLAGAAGVMIGHRLGAGEREEAFQFARRFIWMGFIISLLSGALIAIIAPYYMSIYHISDSASRLGILIIWVFAALLWVKVSNMIIAGGILQSGGDSKFVFVMESSAAWLIGVPLGLLLSFYFKQSLILVYLFLSLEEVVRFLWGLKRFKSRKWMHVLVLSSDKQGT